MPDPDDDHNKSIVIHFVQDPVVPDTRSIAVLGAAEFSHTWRAWLIDQVIDDRREPFPHVRRKSPELPSGGRRELKSVDHVD
jgi:hypothetical protein